MSALFSGSSSITGAFGRLLDAMLCGEVAKAGSENYSSVRPQAVKFNETLLWKVPLRCSRCWTYHINILGLQYVQDRLHLLIEDVEAQRAAHGDKSIRNLI